MLARHGGNDDLGHAGEFVKAVYKLGRRWEGGVRVLSSGWPLLPVNVTGQARVDLM